jgi:hypothetical protein
MCGMGGSSQYSNNKIGSSQERWPSPPIEMGADGAASLLRQAGVVTVVQDKASSVAFGMAGEALQRGAADHPLAPKAIARAPVQPTP